METLGFSPEAKKPSPGVERAEQTEVDEKFREIVSTIFGETALGMAGVDRPFGIDLMTTFMPEHQTRANEAEGMITITTYAYGQIRDR